MRPPRLHSGERADPGGGELEELVESQRFARNGRSGPWRFDRDVLAQPGVTHVIAVLGINHLRNSYSGAAEEKVNAGELIAGLHQIAVRAHRADLSVIVGTVMPMKARPSMAATSPLRERRSGRG